MCPVEGQRHRIRRAVRRGAGPPEIDVTAEPVDAQRRDDAQRGSGAGTDQSSERAAKSRLAFLYHPIPEMGCFHLLFISFRASSCVASPLATTSFRCLSCAFMTSFAVFPWCGKSHGPPSCLHVIVFMILAPFHCYESPDGSAEIVDTDQVARGIAEGAVANAVRLLGRMSLWTSRPTASRQRQGCVRVVLAEEARGVDWDAHGGHLSRGA
jgi:hypothetical protein